MRESDVKGFIKRWLKQRKMPFHEGVLVDFLLSEIYPPHKTPNTLRWWITLEQIECKGTYSNFHRAIGQCLDYFLFYGRIPTYLAVPDDYKYLRHIEKILDYFKLPIGILVVNNRGEILTKRKAKGKIIWKKLVKNKEGGFTTKSIYS